MNFDKINFQSQRTFWGLLVGVAISIILIFWMRNDALATVLGTLVAILITRPERIRDYATLSAAVGVITGPVAGVQQYLFSGEPPKTVHLPSLLFTILGGVILNGCLCAAYGFIVGKFVQLYKKGQGPFF